MEHTQVAAYIGTLIPAHIFIKYQLIYGVPSDLILGFPEHLYLEVAIKAQWGRTNHCMEAETLQIP